MKSKVFILRDYIEVKWNRENEKDPAQMEIVHRGNLQDLNNLLDEGWLIKETIMLKPSNVGLNEGEIQSIVYNLTTTRESKGTQH